MRASSHFHSLRLQTFVKELVAEHAYLLVLSSSVIVAYCTLSLRDYASDSVSGRGPLYVHGWPFAYLTRLLPKETWGSRWQLISGVTEFHLISLLGNLIFGICAAVVLAALWRLHCQERPFWQFSSRELLMVATFIAITAGGYGLLRHRYKSEEALLSSIQKDGWEVYFASGHIPWYLQPLRDLYLIDGENWNYLELAWPAEPAFRDSADINFLLAEYEESKYRLSYVMSVVVDDSTLNDDGLCRLCHLVPACESLDILDCSNITAKGVVYLANKMRHLRNLNLQNIEMTPELRKAVSELPSLEQLNLGSLP